MKAAYTFAGNKASMVRSVFATVFLFVIVLSRECVKGNLQDCDVTDTPSDDVESLIDANIQRLMALRRPGWGWINTPEVVLSIQLSKQHSFFGRANTLEKMRTEFSAEANKTPMAKLALYAMAVRSTCGNQSNYDGINILHKIKRKIHHQWHSNSGLTRREPKDSWYAYGLAVQALCINNVEIGLREVERIVEFQSLNGGFGNSIFVDGTAQVLLALKCLRGEHYVKRRHNLKAKVVHALSRAVGFLKVNVIHEMESVWIGGKYSTPIALSALVAVRGSSTSTIQREVLRSLKRHRDCRIEETEAEIAQKLLALRETSVLRLKEDWTCTEGTDPVPPGYEPSYNPEPNLNCSSFQPSDDIFEQLFAVYISVHLTVSKQSSNSTVTVKKVKKDNSLLQVMAQAKCEGELDFETTASAYGPYVTSVDGLEADPELRQYWSLSNVTSGELLPVGVHYYMPSHNENILFKLKTY